MDTGSNRTTVTMQHDQHFLVRLERLEREHAEIALGLYYDSALVRHILRVAKVPDEAERVALCLGAPELGPHVIVARDGGFVTCLAEGMHLRPDQAVISRHALDQISEEVESLRSLVADAAAGGTRQRLRKLDRIFDAGSGLCQEEFDDIGRWLPLMAVDFLQYFVQVTRGANELADRLARVKKFNRRYDEMLFEFWRLNWAAAHLVMLLGSDGGKRIRKLFGSLELDIPGLSTQLAWGMVRTGVVPFALRGAWIASKLPTWVVPHAKRRYLADESSFLGGLTSGLCLTAVGLRHRKYRAEVAKVMARREPSRDDPIQDTDLVRIFCARYFESLPEDLEGDVQLYISLARQFVSQVYPHTTPEELAQFEALPDDVAAAMFTVLPVPIEYDTDSMQELFVRLPWVVGVEARAFYLPEQYSGIARRPYTREDGLLLLEPRKGLGIARPEPIVAGPKIGRNQPCPCGSGTKYKRCCGMPQPATPPTPSCG